MAGTLSGGVQAAKTNKGKYGADFYSKIGKIGGKNSSNGGFASKIVGSDGLTGKQRAKIVGKLGGEASRPYTKKLRPKEVSNG